MSHYYKFFLAISVTLSYGLAVVLMGLLAYRLFSWLSRHKSLVVFIVTVIYEGETNPGKRDVFLVNSTDGGEHFGDAVNLSNSPDKDSVNSILRVDPSSLNVIVAWIEKSSANSTDDSVRAYCSRC
jgi:hypothetical protein